MLKRIVIEEWMVMHKGTVFEPVIAEYVDSWHPGLLDCQELQVIRVKQTKGEIEMENVSEKMQMEWGNEILRTTLVRMAGEVASATEEMNRAQLQHLIEGLRVLFEATARIR